MHLDLTSIDISEDLTLTESEFIQLITCFPKLTSLKLFNIKFERGFDERIQHKLKLTNLSLSVIGSKVGGRDHSTVIHSFNLINSKREKDINFNKFLDKIEKKLI